MPDTTVNVHVEPGPSKRPLRTEHIGKLSPDTVALYIESKDAEATREPVIIAITQEGLLGRYSPRNQAQPILALTPYGAFQKGVSRAHARLHRDKTDQLTIEDLGSANGTYINGNRLEPYRHYPLTSGDWIALGRLGIEIYYDDSPSRPTSSDTPASGNRDETANDEHSADTSIDPLSAESSAASNTSDTRDRQSATVFLESPARPTRTGTGNTRYFRDVFSIDPGDIHHQVHLIEDAILKAFTHLPQCELKLILNITARWKEGMDGPTLQALKAKSQALKSSRPSLRHDE